MGKEWGSVCKVGTQDPENLDEEVKPLVTVWWESFGQGAWKGIINNNKILIIYIARFRANNINNINNINSIFYYLLPLDCLRED